MRTPAFLSCLLFLALPVVLRAQNKTADSTSNPGPEHHSVTSAHLIRKVAPEYPKKARKKHVEGTVRLHAIIGKDGTVRLLKVISGDPLLTDAAIKAVSQWIYEPTRLDGKPVEVDTTIDVIFALNKTS